MKKVKLGEITEITMGQSPKSHFYNSLGKGMPFLQGNRTFGRRYPTIDTYTTMITRKAFPGDVLMSVRAPVGDLNIAPFDVCLGRGVCSIHMINGNQTYLFYLLKNNLPKLVNMANGTVFGSISIKDISGLEVNIVSNEEQARIVSVLGPIDEKIEINEKINKNLAA